MIRDQVTNPSIQDANYNRVPKIHLCIRILPLAAYDSAVQEGDFILGVPAVACRPLLDPDLAR